MKFIKQFESFNDIDSICKKYGIENYTINLDGSIDVDGDVNLFNKSLNKLPLKFNRVSGDFDCSNNRIKHLYGSPKWLGGNFYCKFNLLRSMEGSPVFIGGSLHCSDNQLISLYGSPASVGISFNCSCNKLKSLYGSPRSIGGYFDFENNKVFSMEGSPISIGGYFNCSNNYAGSFVGFPEFFEGNIYYDYNCFTEILNLFVYPGIKLGRAIDLLNELDVIRGKEIILNRLEQVFILLDIKIPKNIKISGYDLVF